MTELDYVDHLTGYIDSGSSGDVWEARDSKGASPVAIKFMKRKGEHGQSARARYVWALLVDVSHQDRLRYVTLFN